MYLSIYFAAVSVGCFIAPSLLHKQVLSIIILSFFSPPRRFSSTREAFPQIKLVAAERSQTANNIFPVTKGTGTAVAVPRTETIPFSLVAVAADQLNNNASTGNTSMPAAAAGPFQENNQLVDSKAYLTHTSSSSNGTNSVSESTDSRSRAFDSENSSSEALSSIFVESCRRSTDVDRTPSSIGTTIGMKSREAEDIEADHAVFVVPGIAGSSLLAEVVEAHAPACSSEPYSEKLFRIWASLLLMIPPYKHQKCWIELMMVESDEKGEVFRSKSGVTVQADSYGGIKAIEYLSYWYETVGIPVTSYMHGMLKTLQKLGYKPFSTLRGVPYDWRYPPWQFDFLRMKADIEGRYEALNKKVDLIAHSLGCVVLCYFFNKVVDEEWKKKYINTLTFVGAATGGSFKAVKSLLWGYNDATDFDILNIININLFPVELLRDLLRTLGSMYALLPDPEIYGPDHIVAVIAHPPSAEKTNNTNESKELRKTQRLQKKAMLSTGELRLRRLASKTSLAARKAANTTAVYSRISALKQQERRTPVRLVADKSFPHVHQGHFTTDPPSHKGPAEDRFEAANRELEVLNSLPHEERTEKLEKKFWINVQHQKQRLKDALDRIEDNELETEVYTISNWTQLLPADLQQKIATAKERTTGVFKDPGVPVRCIWSRYDSESTDQAYILDGISPEKRPIPIYGYGDGTVLTQSLTLCKSWPSTFETHEIPNVHHMYIFGDRNFNNLIEDVFKSSSQR